MVKEVTTSSVGSNDDWEEIKKEITCSICYELFTDPHTLPCLHTYQPVSIEADHVMIKWNGHDIIQCNVPALLRDYTALEARTPVEEKGDIKKPIGSEMKNKNHKLKTFTRYGPDGMKCTVLVTDRMMS